MKHRPIFAAVVALLLQLNAADWPQWRGPNRDGISTGSAPETWPEKLTLKWKVAAGVGHSSPIYANGKLYIFSRESDDEVVRALDPASGKTLWEQRYAAPYKVSFAAASHGPGPKSTPVFAAGKLYTFGLGGILSCFDASTGRLVWRNDFKGQFKATSPDFGVAMSPIVDGGLLVADVGGDGDGALMAFDADSGAVKWSCKGDGPAYASPVVANFGGVRQVITQTQHNIAGVAASTGELLWRIPFVTNYEQNSVTPLVYGQTLIVSGLDKGVFAIRPVKSAQGWTSEPVWENPQAAMYMNSPVLAGDLLFGFGHKNKGQFFCLDARTGQNLWLSPPRQGENAALVRQGALLFLLKNDAELIVARADGKSFEALRHYTVADSPTWAHPLLLPDGLVVKDKTSVIMWTWK